VNPGRGLTEKLVQARGGRFRTVQAGSGEPLVVFESGLGAGASLWAEVQRQVAAHTATLAYDRAGHALSRPAKDARLFADLNADLEALLDAVGHEGPVILVGQSWGGPIIRAFAHHTRRPVAGLVIVDGTNSTAMTEEQAKGLSVFFTILGKASWLQLHRRWRGRLLKGITAGLAEDDSKRVLRDMNSGRSVRAGAAEAKGLAIELPRMADVEERGFPEGASVTFMSATVAEPGTEEMRARFVARQAAEAERFGARLVVVDTSRHDIHMQEPARVAEEILRIVQQTVGAKT